VKEKEDKLLLLLQFGSIFCFNYLLLLLFFSGLQSFKICETISIMQFANKIHNIFLGDCFKYVYNLKVFN